MYNSGLCPQGGAVRTLWEMWLLFEEGHRSLGASYLSRNEDSYNAYFFTLTYNDENLPTDRQLDKTHLQDFFRSLRKKWKGIRYWAIGEYGSEKGRRHRS